MDSPSRLRLRFRWDAADLAATLERLLRAGFTVSPDGIVLFPSLRIDIVAADIPADRLVQATENDPNPSDPGPLHANGLLDLLAVGWATVDTERFLAEHGGGRLEREAADPHLGAFVARVRGPFGGPDALLLEPNTEGRLSATLVRHGEGPAALYLAAGTAGLTAVAAAVRTAGGLPTIVAEGPLGPSILLIGGPMTGPHLLVVRGPSVPGDDPAAPGTIGP